MSVMPDIALTFVMIVMFVWDTITFPFYFLAYQPWKKTAAFRQVLNPTFGLFLVLI
jgi:hypothetical protein